MCWVQTCYVLPAYFLLGRIRCSRIGIDYNYFLCLNFVSLQVIAFCIFLGSALANYDYDFAHYYEYVYPDQTKTAPVAQLPPVYMYYSQSVPVPQQIAEAAPKVFAEEVPVIQVFNKEAPAPKEIQKEEPVVQLQEIKETPAPQEVAVAPKEEQETLPLRRKLRKHKNNSKKFRLN